MTVAAANLLMSATLVAVTITVCWDATLLGAVYKPDADIVPTLGLNVNASAGLLAPVTVAMNCCVPPADNIVDCGLIDTVSGVAGSMVTPKVSLTPRYEAVKVAAVAVATLAPLTVNEPEAAPAWIVIDDGTIAAVLDELSDINAPPAGAPMVSATLQFVVAGGVSDTALHENPFKPAVREIVTVPPVDVTANGEPVESAACAAVNCTEPDESAGDVDTVSDTVATIPLEIPVEFIPQTAHLTAPAAALQETDLPAAVAADPAARLTDAMSVVG